VENVLKSLLKTPTASNNPPTLYASAEIRKLRWLDLTYLVLASNAQDIGVIGESSRKSSRQNLEIKHPIPIQSRAIINPTNSLGSVSFYFAFIKMLPL
jgi:hypothetical protein